jgi:hypothetical protein
MHSALWKELEAEAEKITGQGIQKRMIGTKKTCPMFVGIKQPGMRRVFLLQAPKYSAPLLEAIPNSKGFQFNVQIIGDEIHEDYASIILTASKADYNDLFLSMADDLFFRLNDLENRKEIVSTFLNRVLLWQSFFEKQGLEGLSEDAQKGLYGELFFLKKYILPGFPRETPLRYWLGSKNRQHDFQFGALAVEVKTTASKQHQKLQISSEQQLDETRIKELFLFYLSVSLVQHSEHTLPALIHDIREVLGGDRSALDLFNSILIERGYLDIQVSLYDTTGYSLRSSGFFLINGDFPRIKENELRRGVGDVKYSIEVDTCSPYTISENEFVDRLRKVL